MKSVLVMLLLVCLTATLGRASDEPSVRLLGKVPDSSYSRGIAISDDGTAAAVNCRASAGSDHFVVVWTATGGLVPLQDSQGDAFMGLATAISADGSTVVGMTAGPMRAFRWTSDDGMEALSGPPGTASEAWDVSADGTAVVGSGNGGYAYLWDANGDPVILNSTQQGMSLSVAGDGQTVLGYTGTWGTAQPFRWTQAGGMQSATYLATHASTDLSEFVFAKSPSSGDRYFWSDATGEIPIQAMAGVSSFAARAVSDNGIVVGDGTGSAWIWTAGDGMRLLDDYLTDTVGLDLGGLHIAEAYDITPDGMTIIGMAQNTPEGYAQAVIVHVPEPATLSLLVLGGLAVLKRKRNR